MCSLLCIMAILGGPPVADSPAPSAGEIARLVERLGADTLSARQTAARELEAIGPAVLPLLPAAATIESAAAREELARIRQRLERQLAEESLQASTVTLPGLQSPVVVMAALKHQTGNKISARPIFEPGTPVQCDWDETPFWTAMADFARQTRRQIAWNSDRGQWELVPRKNGPSELAATSSGPFRIAIRNTEVRESNDLRLLRVVCALQSESRIEPLFVHWPLEGWSVVSEGETSAPWNPRAVFELPFADGSREVTLAMDFQWPSDEPPKRWALAGSCTVFIAAGRERLTFAGSELRRGASLQRHDVTARLRNVRFDGNAPDAHGSIQIVVNYDQGGPAFESHRAGLFHRAAWLENEAGDKFPFASRLITAEADGGMAIEYRFANVSAPAAQYRFIYEAPTLLLEVPVDVQLNINQE